MNNSSRIYVLRNTEIKTVEREEEKKITCFVHRELSTYSLHIDKNVASIFRRERKKERLLRDIMFLHFPFALDLHL